MRVILGCICLALSSTLGSQTRSVEIDPNTKIQGGADLPGSGANAGAGAQLDNKPQGAERSGVEPRIEDRGDTARPQKSDPLKDKPFSAREPQQRDREDGKARALHH
jgi:hypothetical protein